jgi:transposase
MEVMHERCAGLDVHQHTVVVCVRVAADGKVAQEVQTFDTTTQGLLALCDWLAEHACTCASRESTGIYWKPV